MANAPVYSEASGSHRVSVDGLTVRVHDVELFTARPERIPGAPDEDIDEEYLRRLVSFTNARMSGGQFPQVVIEHADHPGASDHAIGRVIGPLRIGTGKIRALPTVYGTLEMSVPDFEAYLRSNRYPRRSVEISTTTEDSPAISQLALLGRRRGAAHLPDTVFFSTSEKGATWIAPDSDAITFNQEKPMTIEDIKAAISQMSDEDKKAVASFMADMFKNSSDDSSGDKDKEDTQNNSQAAEQLAVYSQRVSELTLKIAEIERQRDHDYYSAALNRMKEVEGYSIDDVNSEVDMILSFGRNEQRAAYVDRIRKNYRKSTTAAGLIAGSNEANEVVYNAKAPAGNQRAVFNAFEHEKHMAKAQDLYAEGKHPTLAQAYQAVVKEGSV